MNKTKTSIKKLFPIHSPQSEAGSVLPLAAAALGIIVLLMFFYFQLRSLYNSVNFLEETVAYAAESAARPDPTAMQTGDLDIDADEAKETAIMQVRHSLEQNPWAIPYTPAELEERIKVEVLTPPDDETCVDAPDGRCYYSPVVVVSVLVELEFFPGAPLEVYRSGVASNGASARPERPVTEPTSTVVTMPTIIITPTDDDIGAQQTATPSLTPTVETQVTATPTTPVFATIGPPVSATIGPPDS